MDAERISRWHEVLSDLPWWRSAQRLGQIVQQRAKPGHLLLVGTPRTEPWHLAAHLDDEARHHGLPQLTPQLIRWQPPERGPAHLTIGVDRLAETNTREMVFVVAPESAPEQLLERVADARRAGAIIVSMDNGDSELADLTDERLVVPELASDRHQLGITMTEDPVWRGLMMTPTFDLAQHVVSLNAGQHRPQRAHWRTRLNRMLDVISGPAHHGPELYSSAGPDSHVHAERIFS
ncbi:MAG: hypothetical protein ACRCTR_00980 [Actinomycetota bacterium]